MRGAMTQEVPKARIVPEERGPIRRCGTTAGWSERGIPGVVGAGCAGARRRRLSESTQSGIGTRQWRGRRPRGPRSDRERRRCAGGRIPVDLRRAAPGGRIAADGEALRGRRQPGYLHRHRMEVPRGLVRGMRRRSSARGRADERAPASRTSGSPRSPRRRPRARRGRRADSRAPFGRPPGSGARAADGHRGSMRAAAWGG